jgi:hypothetical protein
MQIDGGRASALDRITIELDIAADRLKERLGALRRQLADNGAGQRVDIAV